MDRSYFRRLERRYCGVAAGEDLAEWVEIRTTLLRLAEYFDVYVEADRDERPMSIDMCIIADQMLDAFNRYWRTKEERHLQTARKYAALLKPDGAQWPALEEMARELPGSPPHPSYY